MQKLFLVIGFVFIAVASQGQQVHLMDTTFLSGEEIFSSVKKMPEFPGGNEILAKFISKNLRYPPAARQNKIEGEVVIDFVINKDGSLSNAKVSKDIGGGCAEEALRVLDSMPDWHPAKHHGRRVNVRYTIAFTFEPREGDIRK